MDILKRFLPPVKIEVLEDVKNNDPTIYPDINITTNNVANQHTLLGRRFDLSMYCFDIMPCDCCGTVHPMNLDPNLSDIKFSFKSK